MYGVCGCCLQCAKQEGQECGAFKNVKGICDVGLYCDVGHLRRKIFYRYASGRCRSKYKYANKCPLLLLFLVEFSSSISERLVVFPVKCHVMTSICVAFIIRVMSLITDISNSCVSGVIACF